MNRFSDFSTEQLIGEKISIDKILNKEIKVLAFRLKNSKIEKGSTYAQIQKDIKNIYPFALLSLKITNIFHSVKEDNHGRIPKIFKN